METIYQESSIALKYLDFLNSTNGQIQQKVLSDAITSCLTNDPNAKILDAGCGPGWLAAELKKHYADVQACDASQFFINFAKVHYPNIEFKVGGLEKVLPYPQNFFDFILLNMVGPDLENLCRCYKNLVKILKPTARLIQTIPNPQYTHPVAQWKRNELDFLLRRKPKLKFYPAPKAGSKIQREFGKAIKIDSYYYTLDDYEKAAKSAGLKLIEAKEITSSFDSKNFDLTYQLYRYPLFLLIEFVKSV